MLALGLGADLGKTLDVSHDNVVAVFSDEPGPNPATGILIHPRVVLTAGHVSPRQPVVAIGANVNDGARWIRLGADAGTQSHPSLTALRAAGIGPNERVDFLDVGLLFLPEPVTTAPIAGLPAPGLLDASTAPLIGVGYGYDHVINARNAGGPGDGRRRSWRAGVVSRINVAWIRMDDNPAKGFGQICRGDSGAPIVLQRGRSQTVVAVVSHSDGNDCGPGIPTYAVRIDNPAVLTWIRDTVKTRVGATIP